MPFGTIRIFWLRLGDKSDQNDRPHDNEAIITVQKWIYCTVLVFSMTLLCICKYLKIINHDSGFAQSNTETEPKLHQNLE